MFWWKKRWTKKHGQRKRCGELSLFSLGWLLGHLQETFGFSRQRIIVVSKKFSSTNTWMVVTKFRKMLRLQYVAKNAVHFFHFLTRGCLRKTGAILRSRNPCAVSRPTPQAPMALADREGRFFTVNNRPFGPSNKWF